MATTRETKKRAAHLRRKMRIRKKVRGTGERPRLVVVRSLKHISASLIDDERGVTLAGLMDMSEKTRSIPVKEQKDDAEGKKKSPPMNRKVAEAFRVGLAIADVAREKGITTIVFDRNGYPYHGRVRAVAEGARKGGLEF